MKTFEEAKMIREAWLKGGAPESLANAAARLHINSTYGKYEDVNFNAFEELKIFSEKSIDKEQE